MEEYGYRSGAVIEAEAEDRALFIRRVYLHLAVALGAFAFFEYLLLHSEFGMNFAKMVLTGGGGMWLGVLAGFAVISWLARGMAEGASKGMQYLGLAVYTFAQALLFVPLIIVAMYLDPSKLVLKNAVILTAILFLALTSVALTQRRDFSYLGAFISIGGLVALGLIVCGTMFGFQLGLAFSGGMIVLASAAILYDTSKVMHHYREDQYVAASLELFASVVLLFWYILRLLMSLQRR